MILGCRHEDINEVSLSDATHIYISDLNTKPFEIKKVTDSKICIVQHSFPNGTFVNCVDRDFLLSLMHKYNGVFLDIK